MKDSINPHKLYKNSQDGVLTGVCAGIGNYFDISPALIRIGFVIAFLFTSGLVLGGYIVLAIVLPKKPHKLFNNSEEEGFWRGVATAPRLTLSELKYKFMTLNDRLKKMEDKITSKEFELEQKYKNL